MISAQMATYTAGRRPLTAGATAGLVLSAAAAKCASITLWLPRLLWLQLSGTIQKITAHLTVWWHKAISLLVGSVMPVVTSGMQQFIPGSAKQKLAAQSVHTLLKPRSGPSTQPLQSVRTLEAKLSWQSGTMSAMHLRATFPTTLLREAPSRSSGSVPSAQQGKSTAGVQHLNNEPTARRQAVHAVWGALLANATPCRRCTLTYLLSGIMPRIRINLAITLLAQLLWLGGPTLSVAAGSSLSMVAPTRCGTGNGGSVWRMDHDLSWLQHWRQAMVDCDLTLQTGTSSISILIDSLIVSCVKRQLGRF